MNELTMLTTYCTDNAERLRLTAWGVGLSGGRRVKHGDICRISPQDLVLEDTEIELIGV